MAAETIIICYVGILKNKVRYEFRVIERKEKPTDIIVGNL